MFVIVVSSHSTGRSQKGRSSCSVCELVHQFGRALERERERMKDNHKMGEEIKMLSIYGPNYL